jgi:hypothetical protein
MSPARDKTSDMREMPPPELPGPAHQPPVVPPLLPTAPRRPARLRPARLRPLPDVVAIQRIPLPGLAPPYDDEIAEITAAQTRPQSRGGRQARPGQQKPPGQEKPPGQLALDKPAPSKDQRGRDGQQQPAGRPGKPGKPGKPAADPGEWPSQFAQVLAETLAGSRPAQQMTPWTTEQARRRIRQLGPQLRADQRPRVRRVLTSVPDSNVVEMTVIIGVGSRVRALAVRLERARPPHGRPDDEGRWLCTAIEAA